MIVAMRTLESIITTDSGTSQVPVLEEYEEQITSPHFQQLTNLVIGEHMGGT